MKKYLIPIAIVLVSGTLAFSQSTYLDWAASDGGIGFDIGRAVALDAQRNSYIAGLFQSTADFDPGTGVTNLISAGDNDAFVQKLDPNGNLMWAVGFGSTMADEAKGIAVDPGSGDVYVTGRFSGTLDFDPGPGTASLTSTGGFDAFILKLRANGSFAWVKQLGGAGSDEGTAIAANAAGVFTVGYYQGTADLNPGAGTVTSTSVAGTMDFFVQHLDSAGNYVWAKALGSDGLEYGFGIATGPNGEVIATGCFQDTIDFDPGPSVYTMIAPSGVTSGWVMRFTANGTFSWARQVGTAGFTIGYAPVVGPGGTVYVTGGFNGTVDLDPGSGVNMQTSNAYDVFLLKLRANGNYAGAWNFGGIGDDYGYAIGLSPAGKLYFTGGYGATVDFDPSPVDSFVVTSFNFTFDAFIEKMDTLGNFEWVVTIGGGGIDYGFGLATDATDRVLTTGCYDFQVDFDPTPATYNLTTVGNAEIYVQMLKQCSPSAASVTLSDCDSVELNGQWYTASGTYTQTLTNQGGCDSMLTANVTVLASSSASLTDTGCTVYSINGLAYGVTGTYSQTLVNAAGCDSILTLHLTIANVDTAVTVNSFSGTAHATNATFQWLDCNNNFFPLPGATASQFVPPYPSRFACAVTQLGCTDTSACYLINFVGAQEPILAQAALFPNPNAGRFMLDWSSNENAADVNITDVLGRIIWKGELRKGEWLDVNAPAGCYTVRLRTDEGAAVLKWIRE